MKIVSLFLNIQCGAFTKKLNKHLALRYICFGLSYFCLTKDMM